MKMSLLDSEVDNRWIVPYLPLISKKFKEHTNDESCRSVKSNKQICKYVTKGRNMAVIDVGAKNFMDKITQYQMDRYVRSNEAISLFIKDIQLLFSWPTSGKWSNSILTLLQRTRFNKLIDLYP